MREPAGQRSPGVAPSAKMTRVQGSLMWALSRNSEWGRVTAVKAMLASPGPAVRVALRVGVPARLAEPLSLRASLGAKGRARQLATWKWVEGLARAPSEPKTSLLTE